MHRYDRLMGWLLPAVVALTPLIIIYALVRPDLGQALFMQGAILALLAGLGAAWALGWRALPGRPTFPLLLLALNAAAIVASLAMSRAHLFSLKQAMLPACGAVFLAMLIAQPGRRRVLRRIRTVLIVEALLLAIYGTMQHFGFEFLNYGSQIEKNRVIATIGHPNFLASVLGPVLFLGLGLALARKTLAWWVTIGIFSFVIMVCVALAQTRGVWFGILVALGVTGLLGARYCKSHGLDTRWLASLTIGAVLILVGLAIVIFQVLPSLGRGVDMEGRLVSPTEVKSRLYYWRTAVDMAAAKPVFGQGYAMFDPTFWDYALEQQKTPMAPYYYDVMPTITGRTPGHVHNEYLEVLAEQGLFGFAALTALLGFFLFFGYWAILRQHDAADAMEGAAVYGALVLTMIDAMFSFPWRLPVSLLVFMVLLAWLYDLIYPQPESVVPASVTGSEDVHVRSSL